MTAMAVRRMMQRPRPRRRLAVALALVVLTGAIAVHHSAPSAMAAMPGHGTCLAVLAIGAIAVAAIGLTRRRGAARPWTPLRRALPTLVALAPRSAPARAGPLYLRRVCSGCERSPVERVRALTARREAWPSAAPRRPRPTQLGEALMTTIHTRARRLLGLAATAALAAALATGCGSSDASNSASPAIGADRAFVQQMIPHHQMAIQMAGSAQRKGEHPQTKALAAAIIAAQTREIGEMKPIAERVGVAPDQMPMGGMSAHMADDAAALGVPMNQTGMSTNMGALDTARPFDRAFVDMMIPHHQGAIRMARGELAKGGDPQLRTIAKAIVADQAKEIGQMNSWRTKWYGQPSPAGGVPAA
jgi:uncharacterized protein (DUF305 family)